MQVLFQLSYSPVRDRHSTVATLEAGVRGPTIRSTAPKEGPQGVGVRRRSRETAVTLSPDTRVRAPVGRAVRSARGREDQDVEFHLRQPADGY